MRAYTGGVEGDTTPEGRERYFSLLRQLPAERRLQAAASLTSAVRALAEAGLRQAHPECDAGELQARLAVRLYGRAVARGLFPALPDDAT
jgi:hypothetical protein